MDSSSHSRGQCLVFIFLEYLRNHIDVCNIKVFLDRPCKAAPTSFRTPWQVPTGKLLCPWHRNGTEFWSIGGKILWMLSTEHNGLPFLHPSSWLALGQNCNPSGHVMSLCGEGFPLWVRQINLRTAQFLPTNLFCTLDSTTGLLQQFLLILILLLQKGLCGEKTWKIKNHQYWSKTKKLAQLGPSLWKLLYSGHSVATNSLNHAKGLQTS